MTNDSRLGAIAAKAERLRRLHADPRMLVLPNAWDAASAAAMAAAGFDAIATTSGGVSGALGLAIARRRPCPRCRPRRHGSWRRVDLPVTVDFEAGYRLEPREIAERMIAIGAAGLNYEDSDHYGDAAMVPAELHAERVAVLREAARAAGVDLVVNARVDVFIHRLGDAETQLIDGLQRAKLYREAGADCVYPILLADETMIAAFVEAVGVVNINLRPGGPITLARAAALGVRRVSYASSMFRETMAALDGLLASVKDEASGI